MSHLDELLPTAAESRKKMAAAEAEKASEYMRKHQAAAEAEKKALMDQLQKPSGVRMRSACGERPRSSSAP